jgi:hypothetical protein
MDNRHGQPHRRRGKQEQKKMKYTVKKVNGFVDEAKEYTGETTTPWVINRYVSGYAIMINNKVVEVYPRKYIAEKALAALSAE